MPQLLNVDFEFTANEDLSGIINTLGDKVFVLYNDWHNGLYYVCIEMNDHNGLEAISDKVKSFFTLLDNLSPDQSKILERAKKVIDIGYESDGGDKVISTIDPITLSQIAQQGFSLVITVYPI